MDQKTKEHKVKAAKVAGLMNTWVGLEFNVTRPMIESIAWALAQDKDLRDQFNQLVKSEIETMQDR